MSNVSLFTKPLKCTYWNINGYKSKIVGNKLEDPKFLNIISTSDIVGLAELHSDQDVSIPGFKCVKQKIREKKFKGPKIAGGLGVFVKTGIDHLVQVVPNKNDDSIWIKLKKSATGDSEDIFIGTYYVSPPNAKNPKTKDFFTSLNDEILSFKKKGVVIVQGDLNARTGNEKDYIEYDKFDDETGILISHNQYARNSEDQVTNSRGKELLDVCKLNDFLILNGRKIGDLFGSYTSHQWNGSSVVDYVLLPNNFTSRISNFSVGRLVPWLSDHCPLHTTILINELKLKKNTIEKEMISIPPGFFWDENAKELFSENLNSTKVREMIHTLEQSSELKPVSIAAKLKEILISNANECKLRKKKYPQNADTRSEPWFDSECKNGKMALLDLGKHLQSKPNDKSIRVELNLQKRNFRKLIATKKRHYKHKILNQMTSRKNEKKQKDFWKLLKKISANKTRGSINIPPYTFAEHFKSILTANNPGELPPDDKEGGPLDYNISLEELKKATGILKPGKALGMDNISNEMIMCLVETYPNIVIKLFNSILRDNEIIPEWVVGAIVPLHKKGSKSEPSNYRGITLMSCLAKLFLTILNNRLMQFTIDNNILSASQLGFLPGNRTSDAHIIINNLVRKYCHKEGKRIYSCFVDFAKAFDTIPRDILFKKLSKCGIRGRFFNIIKNIYTSDKACVKISNKYTEVFGINQGVRQGCVLSPLLFNIFLADLAKNLDSVKGKVKVNDSEISALFWADDILILSDSEAGLREMIRTLGEYSVQNKMEINTDKTKVMIFNKTGRLLRRSYYINGIQLENVRSYKYLGFVLTPSGEINTGLHDLRDRALKAFMKLKNDLGTSFNQDVLTTLSLVDTMIKLILLYNSDFWGSMKLPKSNPIETLDMMMYKTLLGVHKNTTNMGVLLELGRVPIQLHAIKFSVKNWERIRKKEANELLLASYKDARNENCSVWLTNIQHTLGINGMTNFFLNEYENNPSFIHRKLFQRMSDQFHQNAFETIKGEQSKLRTYSIFKTEIGFEDYLSNVENPKCRAQVTKLRLSNHDLMIETGRHRKLPKEIRVCPFCPKSVETETHFLMECSTYDYGRKELFRSFVERNAMFQLYTMKDKFEYLMTNICTDVALYIVNCFQIRTFLMTKPKQSD